MPDKELKWSDARRILAIEMHEKGIDIAQIMAVVEPGRSTIYEWIQRAELEGKDSLIRTYKARERKLDPASRERLELMLDQSVLAHGHEDQRLTLGRVQQLILREFQVSSLLCTVSLKLELLKLVSPTVV